MKDTPRRALLVSASAATVAALLPGGRADAQERPN